MKRSDILSSATVFVFGLIVLLLVIPKWIPGHEDGGYGLQPGDFPRVTMLVATLIAGVFCISRILTPKKEAESEAPAQLEIFHGLFLAGAMGVLVVALLLFDTFGFLAGGPFVLAVFIYMMGERNPLPIILISAIIPLVLWAFFWKLLEFPLP